ncbi:hypothetical protein B0O44_11329 [Pedobacter nutrimenti]|uniref:Uncharacterized protein n=1 Tax=Pedobacter nutrimenti TaxID=1241337 RepID=A0A318U5V4_9SPHI|nr:hypothetical protein B0O44_11329 [Pedobacter nutrimenti]
MDGSDANKQMSQKMKADKIMPSGLAISNIPGIDAQSKLIRDMLDLPLYKEVETEYQKVVASGKKKPAWYQLYGGPPNLEQLATRLNRQGMYEIFYRAWSGSVHGQEVIKGNLTTGADAGVVQLRNPKDAQQVTLHAHNLILILYHLFVEKRLPQEMDKFKSWYMSIRGNLEQLRVFKS